MTETQSKETIQTITDISRDLAEAFDRMKAVPGMYDDFMARNCDTCQAIPDQIIQGEIRIAVVGAIKSGKTTFVNGLLRQDLLKRGAGVVTSIVTRVKQGKKLKAKILFKSWDEINQEIGKALLFLPDMTPGGFEGNEKEERDKRTFDLRRKSDRQFLKAAKMRLYSDFSVTENGIRPEAALIANAVDGYSAVKHYMQADPSYTTLTGAEFVRHGEFTGNGACAFFVKDVLLEIPPDNPSAEASDKKKGKGSHKSTNKKDRKKKSLHPALHTMAEIADCQGSDSTDPSHMIHIQDYLISANLLIYLISSRTGLREADLRFLKMIRSMGILQNVLFVLNVDLSEHDTLEELNTVEESVRAGLGYFIDSPHLYTFSTLYDLFSKTSDALTPKNIGRLEQWRQEKTLSDYCKDTGDAFEKELHHMIFNRYHAIMLDNPIARLKILADGARKRSRMFRGLLSANLSKASTASSQLNRIQARSSQFESLMDTSIDNALKRIRQDASAAIHDFFDTRRGNEAVGIKRFIMEYDIYSDRYEEMIAVFGFQHALYTMFQDFRSELDRFMATQFTPVVAEFVREQELQIASVFHALYQSCYMDPSVVYGEGGEGDEDGREASVLNGEEHRIAPNAPTMDLDVPFSISAASTAAKTPSSASKATALDSSLSPHRINGSPVDLDAAKRILGLQFPRISFAAGYSAKIKADAMARLGFYTVMEVFGKLMKLLVRPARATTLREASKRMRKETLRSVENYFSVYRDLVEEEYLFPLLQATARDFRDKLMEMFQMCKLESRQIETMISNDQSEKKSRLEALDALDRLLVSILKRVDGLSSANHGV